MHSFITYVQTGRPRAPHVLQRATSLPKAPSYSTQARCPSGVHGDDDALRGVEARLQDSRIFVGVLGGLRGPRGASIRSSGVCGLGRPFVGFANTGPGILVWYNTYVYTYIYICVHRYLYIYKQTLTNTHTHIFVRVYIYTYTHTNAVLLCKFRIRGPH